MTAAGRTGSHAPVSSVYTIMSRPSVVVPAWRRVHFVRPVAEADTSFAGCATGEVVRRAVCVTLVGAPRVPPEQPTKQMATASKRAVVDSASTRRSLVTESTLRNTDAQSKRAAMTPLFRPSDTFVPVSPCPLRSGRAT